MSEFSLSPETWLGLGTAAGGAAVAILGAFFGGKKREETSERVVGLSLAGGMFQTGQGALTKQTVTDAIDVGKDGVLALKDLAVATRELKESVEHFDETTEREARDHTRSQLDEITETLKKLG